MSQSSWEKLKRDILSQTTQATKSASTPVVRTTAKPGNKTGSGGGSTWEKSKQEFLKQFPSSPSASSQAKINRPASSSEISSRDDWHRLRMDRYRTVQDQHDQLTTLLATMDDYDIEDADRIKKELESKLAKLEASDTYRNKTMSTKYAGKTSAQLGTIAKQATDPGEKSWLEYVSKATESDEDRKFRIARNTDEKRRLEEMMAEAPDTGSFLKSVYTSTPAAAGTQNAKQKDDIAKKYGYSSWKEATDRYDAIEREMYFDQNARKYDAVKTEADFAEKSQYDESKGKGVEAGEHAQYNRLNQADMEGAQVGPNLLRDKYDYMTEEDLATYNYIYNTEGKEAAEDYLDYMAYHYNELRQYGIQQDVSNWMDKGLGDTWIGGALASNASVPLKLASGIAMVDVAGQKLRNKITGEDRPVDFNTGAWTARSLANGLREGTAQNLNELSGTIQLDETKNPFFAQLLNGKGLGDVYSLGMSMADSGVVAALSPIIGPTGVALLATSAGADGIQTALESGATDDQAITMGVINAAAEALFEKVSLDNLIKSDPKKLLTAMLQQGGVEASEEASTSIANLLGDYIVMAENSEWKKDVAEYMNAGDDVKTASWKAFWGKVADIAMDAIGGFITGGLMGGGSTMVQNAQARMQYGDQVGSLLEDAASYGVDTKATQKAQKRMEAEKSVSGSTIRQVMSQTEDAKVAQAKEAKAKVFSALSEEMLAERGETENATEMAQIIGKMLTRQKVTLNEMLLFRKSKNAADIVNELADMEAYAEIDFEQYASSDTSTQPITETAQEAQEAQILEAVQVEGGTEKVAPVANLPTETDAEAIVNETATEEAYQPDVLEEDAADIDAFAKQYANPTAYKATFQGNQDPTQYDVAYRAAYEMGMNSEPVTQMQRSAAVQYLTPEQQIDAYREGEAAAKAQATAEDAFLRSKGTRTGERKRGNVKAMGGVNVKTLTAKFNDSQRKAYRILDRIAEVTGINIVLYESHVGENGQFEGEQGRFARSTPDTIYIDINAGLSGVSDVGNMAKYTMLATFSHEFTHFCEAWNPIRYNELRKLVFETMEAKGVSVEDRIDALMAEDATLTREAASREVVAEAMVDILPDANFIEQLATKHQSLFQKLVERLKEFLASIRDLFSGMEKSEYASVLKEELDGTVRYMESIVKLFDNVAVEAVETMQESAMESFVEYDAATKSVAPATQYSRRTWNESTYVKDKEAAVVAISLQLGVSREQARQYIEGDVQKQRRSAPSRMSDREALVRAANLVTEGKFTPEERDALHIYRERFADMSVTEAMLREQEAIQEENLAEGLDNKATKNRIKTLQGKLNRETEAFLRAEQSTVVRKIVEKAREVAENAVIQETRTEEQRLAKQDKREALKEYREAAKQDKREALKELRKTLIQEKVDALREERAEAKLDKRESLAEYRAKRHESELKKRHKMRIRKTIMDLDKLLNRGNKQANVKEEMRELVSGTLRAAEVLFLDEYTAEDMVRNGVGVELSDREAKHMQNAKDIMAQMNALTGSPYDVMQKRNELQKKLDYQLSQMREVFQRERKRLYAIHVEDVVNDLSNMYRKLTQSENGYIQAAFDENVAEYLQHLNELIGAVPVRDMNAEQLDNLSAAFTMILQKVRTANKAFAENIRENIETMAYDAITEEEAQKKKNKYQLPAVGSAQALWWNNEKPGCAMERIGSKTMTTLYNNVADGENTFAQDIEEAKDFKEAVAKKYGMTGWDFKTTKTFRSSSGLEFELNLGQIMSLYAYAKREAAHDHITKGGIVFPPSTKVRKQWGPFQVTMQLKDATAYNISDDLLQDILSDENLTQSQKSFVDEMQEYLSSVMGAKGNEVSRAMYGVRQFGEPNYFPIRVSGKYHAKAEETEMKKQAGQTTLASAGFTKGTVPHASNPIVLESFMDVWSDHVNDMSLYHSFVLPLADFQRVFNFNTPHMEGGQSKSVKASIDNAHGAAATNYVSQLLSDINGGVMTDSRDAIVKKMISRFKKAAVVASASVVVQQQSALFRAKAMIDSKYFGKVPVLRGVGALVQSTGRVVLNHKQHTKLWEQAKHYAPGVVTIKDIGGFDTATGQGIANYLGNTEREGFKSKLQGFLTDPLYRSNAWDAILGYLPSVADETAWVEIWLACKRETMANHKGLKWDSEEMLKISGQRFTEVIRKTQVYDSVFSKSSYMRSKSTTMAMLTSFMAEPTTTINMVEEMIANLGKKNFKPAFKTGAAVLQAIVINNLMRSLVYAMRDDDDDETYLEKYVAAFISGLSDDLNPLNYYPYLRDINSILSGYDVERADMSLVSEVTDKLKQLIILENKETDKMDEEELTKHNKATIDAWFDLAGSISSLFGFPGKNIKRTVTSIINTWEMATTPKEEQYVSSSSLWNKVREGVNDSLPFFLQLETKDKRGQLYESMVSGDAEMQKRLESGYKDADAFHAAIRKALRENDPRIKEAAQARYNGDIAEYTRLAKEIRGEKHFVQDDIVAAIDSEVSLLEPEGEKSDPKAKGLYKASDFAAIAKDGEWELADAIIEDMVATKVKNGQTQKNAESNTKSSIRTELKEDVFAGSLSKENAIHALTIVGDLDQDEATAQYQDWMTEQKYGYDSGEVKEAYMEGNITQADAIEMRMAYTGDSRSEAAEEVAKWSTEKSTGYAYDDIKEAFLEGDLTSGEAIAKYKAYGVKDADARDKVAALEFQKRWPGTDGISASAVRDYQKYCASAGVSGTIFYKAYQFASDTHADVDKNGNSINGTRRKKVLKYIDSLPLNTKQKDAIYYALGWAKSTLDEAPWH